MLEPTIKTLHHRSSQGDSASEKRLFQVLSERFREFARRRIWDQQDAEEIVQDALMVIYRDYREITYTSSFTAWAYKVLDNRILAYLKNKKRRNQRQVTMDHSDLTAVAKHEDFDPDVKRRLLECLRKTAIANQRYARILNLHYQGYTTDHICRRMGLTPNGFYILLSRARAMLRTCLGKGDTASE